MINKESYKLDSFYPKVVDAVDAILSERGLVTPVEVFLRVGTLDKAKHDEWRFGRAPSLESVIQGGFGNCSKILKILCFHAFDLDLKPSEFEYKRWGKGKAHYLKFSKSKNRQVEAAYSVSFKWHKRMSYLEWKQDQADELNP